MKNWETLEPDKYALVGSHRYTPGRTHPIDRIVIHHNAGVRLTTEQVRDLWNTSREASAHYQVEADGTIGQLVNDVDTAWHAANADINARSIGIEHANISGAERWQISDQTIEQGAHLVAAICHAYNLGRPEWGKNVFPHSQYTGTSCPYQLDVGGEDHITYMARAAWWYDNFTTTTQHTTAPTPVVGATQPKETPVTTKFFTDFVTGYFSPQFDAIQEIWRQLRGPAGKGWPQLGTNDKGQNLTLVDAIAALRADVARIEKKLEAK